MKMMKKLFAVVMIMVLAMSLCGCGNTAEKLYGSWEMTIDYSAEIEAELDEEGFHEAFDIKLILEFNEDGTFSWYADEAVVADSLDTWMASYAAFAYEKGLAEYAEMGYSREEVDAMSIEQYGVGLEEAILQQMKESLTAEDLASEMYMEGVWEAKGDKLYMDEVEVQSNVYDNFTVEGDTLTVSIPEEAENADAEIIAGMEYPLVFTRVAAE